VISPPVFRPFSAWTALICGAYLAAAFSLPVTAHAQETDLTASYEWKPVRIGAGGWVVGMTIHPLNSTVRYLRTDVGNAYRWDDAASQWIPMRVRNADGTGIQGADPSAPGSYGEESIAVDPTNTAVVYMVFPSAHSCDVQCPTGFVEIYKSTDGGMNFTPGGLGAAQVKGNPNGPNRMDGERLVVDPANPQMLYYGSEGQGLYRSMDDGATWTQYAAKTGLPVNVEFIDIQFAGQGGTASVSGKTVTRVVYAVSIRNNGDAGGDVYRSSDGGQTWTDISTGVVDKSSGQKLSGQALSSSMDSADNLYIPENCSTNGYHRAYWKFAAGKWTRVSLESGNVIYIGQPLTSVAVDPVNLQRIYAMGVDTGLSRSDDGGVTWKSFGGAQYANTFGWLPQKVGMTGGGWHSNGGLRMDPQGNLWVPTGQEGALTIASSVAAGATAANPPKWTITSTGVEEQVAQDIAIPPGSNDTIVAAAEDTTGFVIPNPDTFSAAQIPLQQEIISQGTSVDYSPDTPSYIAITSSNVYNNGPNYSGYSADGGKTWKPFGAALKVACGSAKCDVQAGTIAVSVRGTRTLGHDHIVILPPNNLAPEYSQDGGATWHVTQSFPLAADGLTLNTANGAYAGLFYAELSQRLLRADPFVADKFYLKLLHAPEMLYISTDGGQTWTGQSNAGLPDYAWHGQLAANSKVKNDLWYADGWEGSTAHGVYHSTNGGATFTRIAGIAHAIAIAIGAGRGNAGDQPYTVYFYGQFATDPAWGIFQSTNGGATWNRIAYYPAGIYDRPDTMAASQDTFGKVYVGFGGNSFVYGQLIGGPSPPAAPTGLSAKATSDTQIDLAWTAPAGTLQSYTIFRGTAAGAEASAPLETGVTQTTYADATVSTGKTYFYKVEAVNSALAGAPSNEASAFAEVAPAAPTALGAKAASNSRINLAWTAPAGPIQSYSLYRGTTAGAEATAPLQTGLTAASCADTAVTTGKTYFYKVAAVNAAGTGAQSSEASALAEVVPLAPTALSAKARSSTEIDISWTAPASSIVSTYDIFRGTKAGGESATPLATGLTAVSYRDTGAVQGTTYYYRVAAVNAAGMGPDSNEASAKAAQPSAAGAARN
jgi:fibronectin type 3 domain-containing protein